MSTGIANDFAELLPSRQGARSERDDRPIYYLWTFDPSSGKVHLDHNENKHPANAVTHDELAPHVKNPIHGFAYSIKGGWRITNDDHKAVDDPYILRRVHRELDRLHAPKELPTGFLSEGSVEDLPIPHIRYHGAP